MPVHVTGRGTLRALSARTRHESRFDCRPRHARIPSVRTPNPLDILPKQRRSIMDESQANLKTLDVLNALAQGVDPRTGELFAADCPYHDPQVVRALFTAVRALESAPAPASAPKPAAQAPMRPREGAPSNAGKAWSPDEDRQLLAEFDSGKTLKECANLHQRTFAGIEARLEKLGRLKAEDRTTSRRYPPASRTADDASPLGRSA